MKRRRPTSLRIGTRGSKLALWQAEHVAGLLRSRASHLSVIIETTDTYGDRHPDTPIESFMNAGVFTDDIESALLAGEIDLAVHSMKDLPVGARPGLTIGAVPVRADVRDALVSRDDVNLAGLPTGATVGTSSRNRTAQLLALRADLNVRPIRGNVDVRVAKVDAGEYDGVVLAAAGLRRLGLRDRISQMFSIDELTPSPAQGALAVQCRTEDKTVRQLLKLIDQPELRLLTTAERTLQEALGGDGVPVAASAWRDTYSASIKLIGKLVAADGRTVLRVEGEDGDPRRLGKTLAAKLIRLHASAA